jgi:hypothetical protein
MGDEAARHLGDEDDAGQDQRDREALAIAVTRLGMCVAVVMLVAH